MSLVGRQISVEEDTEEFGKWGFFSWLPVSTLYSNGTILCACLLYLCLYYYHLLCFVNHDIFINVFSKVPM